MQASTHPELRIAIITDIHANKIALEAVLADISAKGISEIYCLCDLVDFAPWGNEVIEIIRHNNIPCLMGNHDERIAFDEPISPLPHHNAQESAERMLAIAYSKQQISPQNKDWLAQLPYTMELSYQINGQVINILLVHASLSSNDQYVFEADNKAAYAAALRDKGIQALLMGHTHLPYIQSESEVLFVNAGSVGRSREADRKASYAILSLSDSGIDAEIIKLAYNLEAVADAIYASPIPDFYGDFLRQVD